MQRLDPQLVPRGDELLACNVPDGEREHAVQSLEDASAPLFEAMENHLGIASGAKPMSGGGELLSKFVVIVDLAIEDDPCRFVFIRDRLMATRYVNDAEPTHPERHGPGDHEAIVIGSAMGDSIAHGLDTPVQLIAGQGSSHKAGNTTHQVSPRLDESAASRCASDSSIARQS